MVPRSHTPALKFVFGFVVFMIGAVVGIPMAHNGEVGDAPGLVVIGVLIAVGAAMVAIWIVNQRPESRARK